MPDVIVTIVPGTWARGFLRPTVFRPEAPRWFEPGGRFYVDLEKALRAEGFDPTLHSYTWSGDNSLVARNDAERGLVEHVRRASAERPGVLQVLVGHSHGGAVAFRAAGALGHSAGDLLVATIATPFLEVREQYISRVYKFGLWLLLFLSIGLPIMKFMKAGFATWVDDSPALYGGMVTGWLCYRAMKLLISSPRWQRLVDKTCKSFQVQCPVLVLRARLDEAALAIRVGNAAQAMGTFLRHSCTFLVFAISMAFVGLGVYLMTLKDLADALAFAMKALLPVMALEDWRATLGAAAISLLAAVALKGVNGSELAACIASVSARVDGTPRGASKVEIAVLPKVGWLAHSLHENPLAATRIATWLASVVKPDRQ